MAVTPATFRTSFPAFASTTVYPDPMIQFWIDLGLLLLNVDRWGNLLDYGLQLFVAHNLVLEAQSNKQGASGNSPGQIEGPVTSGTVDKVSYQRDPGAAMDPANGHWNLTTYGLRYIRLVNMVGAGPIHVGVPMGGESPDYYPQAWPGPMYGPN